MTTKPALFIETQGATGGPGRKGRPARSLAPARLATVWMRPSADAAERFGLRPAESGANVLIVEPNDDLMFEGATEVHGLRYAALSQVAADLLTSPGRGPAEGEALLEWMQGNEEAWRG